MNNKSMSLKTNNSKNVLNKSLKQLNKKELVSIISKLNKKDLINIISVIHSHHLDKETEQVGGNDGKIISETNYATRQEISFNPEKINKIMPNAMTNNTIYNSVTSNNNATNSKNNKNKR